MIDPLLSLAFSVQANPGVFALLLGSGVSRAAGIPTGWEIVVDLVEKLAYLQGEACEPTPEEWYRSKYGEEPAYSKLLAQICHKPAERQRLLRSYFEPTEQEREDGKKQPTEAHRAIAELVAGGMIRVIVTTNFDRLLEQAIEAAGVTPTVLSTADAVRGAVPPCHTRCTILKVNGDYLDPRIRNTPDELAKYLPVINRLLDRIFDEHGLIVCGWSGEWDRALCTAMERCTSRRYSTYWACRSAPKGNAQCLVQHRQASPMTIRDADSFFRRLADNVRTIENFAQPHPLTATVATAMVKRYLVDDRYRIQLEDLVLDEVENLTAQLRDSRFSTKEPVNNDEVVRRFACYESATEVVRAILMTCCYWSDRTVQSLWANAVERILNDPVPQSGMLWWVELSKYPSLLLIYACGVTGIARQNYEALHTLLYDVTLYGRGGRDLPLALTMDRWSEVRWNIAKGLPGLAQVSTPLSRHLRDYLRESFRRLLPDDDVYAECFDRFEYFVALAHVDQRERVADLNWPAWVPVGLFGLRWSLSRRRLMEHIDQEVSNRGDSWAPLTAGFFKGDLARFHEVRSLVDAFVEQLRWL